MATDMPDCSSRAQMLVGMPAPTVQSWKKNQTHRQVYLSESGSGSSIGRLAVEGGTFLTDSDWAGDLDTWKSTGGSINVLGEHYLRVFGPRSTAPPH